MSTVAELEQQLTKAKEKEKYDKFQQEADDYNKRFKGKVFSRFVRSTRREFIYITYFHNFFVDKSYNYGEGRVLSSNEQIEILKNIWGKNKRLTYTDHSKKGEEEGLYSSLNMIEWGDQIAEIPVEEFNRLKKTIIGLTKSIADDFFSDKEIKYNCDLRGTEYDEFVGDRDTVDKLDLPHLRLTPREAFLLNKSIFMRHDNYLLSPNSIVHALDSLQKGLKAEYNSISLSSQFGYRYKDKVQEYNDLIKKFKEAKYE